MKNFPKNHAPLVILQQLLCDSLLSLLGLLFHLSENEHPLLNFLLIIAQVPRRQQSLT